MRASRAHPESTYVRLPWSFSGGATPSGTSSVSSTPSQSVTHTKSQVRVTRGRFAISFDAYLFFPLRRPRHSRRRYIAHLLLHAGGRVSATPFCPVHARKFLRGKTSCEIFICHRCVRVLPLQLCYGVCVFELLLMRCGLPTLRRALVAEWSARLRL